MAIPYLQPDHFIRYRLTNELFQALVDAKAGVESLRALPFQKSWMEPLKAMELKIEVAGTSMIEGATFVGRELDEAYEERTPEAERTRSQRQLISAKRAYKWIEQAPLDLPIDRAIREIQRLMITGSDDDHAEPGRLRGADENVTFGRPLHRGAPGGEEVRRAYAALLDAATASFAEHEPLLQALALHYHLAAIHPFQDGNGRCARGVEAYLLRRSGYSTHGFIGLSNYYYEERNAYLKVLAETRQEQGDLTSFFVFALRGISQQCRRIRDVILNQNKIVLFKNMMYRVYARFRSKRRRELSDRQIRILDYLLDHSDRHILVRDLISVIANDYSRLSHKGRAFARDIVQLEKLQAVHFDSIDQKSKIRINLDWPQLMTDTEFGQKILERPSRHGFPIMKI
jgi:Fic family protein